MQLDTIQKRRNVNLTQEQRDKRKAYNRQYRERQKKENSDTYQNIIVGV